MNIRQFLKKSFTLLASGIAAATLEPVRRFWPGFGPGQWDRFDFHGNWTEDYRYPSPQLPPVAKIIHANDYRTIQDAINSAPINSTILIDSGIYPGMVHLDKPANIVCVNRY